MVLLQHGVQAPQEAEELPPGRDAVGAAESAGGGQPRSFVRTTQPECYAVSISLTIREIPPSMPEKNATPFLLNAS